MSKIRRTAGYILRLALAAGIIVILLHSINKTVQLVSFVTGTVQVEAGAVYEDTAHPGQRFVIHGSPGQAGTVDAIHSGKLPSGTAQRGVLTLKEGSTGSAQTIEWQSFTTSNYGLRESSAVFLSAFHKWPWWLAGVLLFAVCTVGLAVRWRIVLSFSGIDVSFWRSVSVTYIGFFFNLFTLGATGGDLVKAYYVTRETAEKKPEAVSTVFIDRLIGMPALTVLAAAGLLSQLDFVLNHNVTRLALIMVIGLLAVMIPVFATIFWRHIFDHWRLFKLLEKKTSFGPMLRRIYDAFFRCRYSPRMLLKTAGISIAMQALMIVVLWCFGRALSIEQPLADYLVVIPAALLIGGLPLTPGGIGLREGTIVIMLAEFGMPATQSLPLSLMLLVTSLSWYAAGGFCLMFYKAVPRPA